MVGYLQTPNFYFLLDDDRKRSARHQRDFDEELEERILSIARLPDLGSAPLGSWFIARLAELTKGRMGLLYGEDQHVDGGSCVLDIEVFSSERQHVGSLQVQCGDGVDVFGTCSETVEPEEILGQLVQALVADPSAVREFEVRVLDPEDGSRRVYGFDGTNFLGHTEYSPPPDR